MQLRKICKQSCTAFQTVLVYYASTLWKKSSYSQKKPSNLRCSCTTNAYSVKCSEGWRLFSDAYQSFVPSLVHNVCGHGNFHCIYHKIFTCSVGSIKKQCLWLPSKLHCFCAYRSNFSVSQQELSAAE